MSADYGYEFQLLMLAFMVSDPTSYAQSQDIIKPDYFDDRLRPAARFILQYSNDYHALPTKEQVKAMTHVEIMDYPDAPKQAKWYLDQVEKFCRYRALELAVLKGADLLEKGEGGKIEALVKEAMQISLVKDLGTSYFSDPRERLNRLNDKSNMVPTGWKSFDKKLEGGFTRGSLNIFAGGSGSGKSLFLQNLARKWSLSGLNVIYITLELSEDLVNLRLDSMVTNKGTAWVRTHINDTALQVMTLAKKQTGDLKVKKFPEAGTTCNTIRAYLKEYEIQEGHAPDVLLIDYLDLMHPNNAGIDVSNLFTKDKYVSEEMRAIGTDWNIPVVSASQLNRSSVEAQEFDHSHIAGGISKINTADNVMGIFTSMSMKERGVYQLQFLKTRSASSTGHKIELYYNNTSMLIEDLPETEEDREIMKPVTAADIKAQLANQPTSTRGEVVMEEREVKQGMSISQAAMPSKPAQASPLKNDVMDLMKRINRNGNEN